MGRKNNRKLNNLIEEYGVKDMNNVCEFVKMLTAKTIQELWMRSWTVSLVTASMTTKTSGQPTAAMYILPRLYRAVWVRWSCKFPVTATVQFAL